MQVTNQDLANAVPALNELFALKLPARAAFTLAKAIKLIEPLLAAYEKTRVKLVDQYARRNDDGEMLKDGDNVQISDPVAFNAEMEELLKQVVEMDIKPLGVEDFGSSEIHPNTFLQLGWLVQ